MTLSGVTCIAFPADFGVSAELRVRRMVLTASFNWTASFLMRLGCETFHLMSRRPSKSRDCLRGCVPILFDPATKDIFRLSLISGDELAWQVRSGLTEATVTTYRTGPEPEEHGPLFRECMKRRKRNGKPDL